eukprot:TRINITY_DN35959_c0_g1_i10.p1 TRINITY_DN35959_c0_g1~~TRINITY_DN35959_c0_g1_i10.p1  ORF type:complete len:373 (-),score=41.54 TRINITY_DN35959_c0_g1_i10:346-1338(-)
MEYRKLGNSGLKVSALSYGSWVTFGNQVQTDKAKGLMQKCVEYGVNFFDNAEVYSNGESEIIMGKCIKELGLKRSDLVLSTKIFWGGSGPNDKGLSRKHIVEGTKASLARMGQEYVDLLFCHRPDETTPIEETVRAMNYVIDQGLAFYWGTSEWSAQQITQAWDIANRLDMIGPLMEQPEYNIFHRERVEKEYSRLYTEYGIGLTTWSPLSSGVLTGKYASGQAPQGSRLALEKYKGLRDRKLVEKAWQLKVVEDLRPLASELGCSLAQLSIAWCAKNPHVSTVITGATSESQIIDNMGALDVIPKMTDEVMYRIEKVVEKWQHNGEVRI